MYQQYKDPFTGNLAKCVVRLPERTYIPFDPANTDYQAYLKWLDEGNMPLPADEVTP